MNPYETVADADRPRAHGSKPRWQRALVIFAGPGSHFVVAALLFASLFTFFGVADANVPLVSSVAPTLNGSASPAVVAGVRPGDVITGVGGVRDPTWDQLSRTTTAWARDHADSPLSFTILRQGRTIHLDIVPVLADVGGRTIGRIGITAITISYHRPLVNDRKVWDALVPYGKVWRAGAKTLGPGARAH